MIPSPFVSDDYLRSRTALPFGKPLVHASPFSKPFYKSVSFGELPMVRAYKKGGMIRASRLKK